MKKSSIVLIVSAGLFILAVSLPKNFSSSGETLFKIEKGEGSKEIAQNLKEGNFIRSEQLFRAYIVVRNTSDKMQAGSYRISPSMSIFTIAEKFASGDVAKELITIPEGFTSEQILQKLQPLQLAGSDPANLAALQEHEGYLFPDTYEIPYGAEASKVIEMMTGNFARKTAGVKATADIVIMASMLEKEVKTKEEKELAAGVLWKRLKAGWPLQVNAVMWTYENTGLPEKPICNPGFESILAALNPKKSPYWYYLSKPDGETLFSKTLEEHNIARAKYLK